MREVVIVDGVRTAFGKLGGSLRDIPGTSLAVFVVKALVAKTKITEKAKVDSLLCGCALSDSQASSPARFTALAAGLGFDVPGTFTEQQCGSAISSINAGAWKIMAGSADIIIAGGFESYSQSPVKFSMSVPPYKLIPPMPLPMKLAPTPDQAVDMITVNDMMAEKWGVSRQECDEYAYNSQMRSANAIKTGLIGPEIIPYIYPATKKTPEVVFKDDEQLRPDTTLEGLAKLASVKPGGVTTAGNASGRNDGAAFVLMMTAEKAKELGYTPYLKFVVGADVGVEPRYMGIGAAEATLKVMHLAGLKLKDIDAFESNEAFAAQQLSCIKEVESRTGEKVDRAKWNPNGGAISFGHPNGASGGRITIFLMKQLEKMGGKYGIISSCCGGGMGVATLFENVRR